MKMGFKMGFMLCRSHIIFRFLNTASKQRISTWLLKNKFASASIEKYEFRNSQRVFCNVATGGANTTSLTPKNDFTRSISVHLVKILEPLEYMTPKEWDGAFKQTPNAVKTRAIDFMIMRYCVQNKKLSLGHSYKNYVESTNRDLTLQATLQYLLICAFDDEHKTLLSTIDKLSTDEYLLPDQRVIIIEALCKTKHWERAYEHLEKFEKGNPSMPGKVSIMYENICEALAREKGMSKVWKFLKEKRDGGYFVQDSVIIKLLNYVDKYVEKHKKFAEYKVLLTLLPKTVISTALEKEILEKLKWKWIPSRVSITNREPCPACGHSLKESILHKDAVHDLKNAILKVVKGDDLFQNTNPYEWKKFQDFLVQSSPFDIVVDGLNLFYISGLHSNKRNVFNYLSNLYRNSSGNIYSPSNINHLQAISKSKISPAKGQKPARVLFVSRRHLEKQILRVFPNNRLPKEITFYFLDDVSSDDLFVLYSALYSGLGTRIISRDLMRKHRFLLENDHLREKFVVWQRQHQLNLEFVGNKVVAKLPYKYDLVPQETPSGGWHLPLTMEAEKYYVETEKEKWLSYSNERNWICLQVD